MRSMQMGNIRSPKEVYQPLVVNRPEAAEVLRISIRQLDSLIRRGEIRATRIDARVVLAWAELLRFVEKKSSVERNRQPQGTLNAGTGVEAGPA